MLNFKKIIIALLLCNASLLYIFSQSNNTQLDSSSFISEESIVLADDTASSNNVQTEYKSSSIASTFLRMIFALIIVVGLIYIVLRFIKKKTHIVKNDDEYLRRVSYINISPSKTIEIITLLDKGYLIGVTEDNITLLGEINDKELVEAMNINADKKTNSSKPINFSQVLETFLAKGNKNIFSSSESKVVELFNSNTETEKNEE